MYYLNINLTILILFFKISLLSSCIYIALVSVALMKIEKANNCALNYIIGVLAHKYITE